MKRIVVALAAVLTVVVLSAGSCSGSSATQKDQSISSQELRTFDTNQPPPKVTWSQLRQNLTEVELAQSNPTPTTTFFFNMGVQDPIQSCPSIGFPIPATDQITNPQQITGSPYHSGGFTVPQIDPNGIYSGDSTGTYVICLNTAGQAYADYWEGFVQTVSGSASWDYNTHRMTTISNPTGHFTVGKS